MSEWPDHEADDYDEIVTITMRKGTWRNVSHALSYSTDYYEESADIDRQLCGDTPDCLKGVEVIPPTIVSDYLADTIKARVEQAVRDYNEWCSDCQQRVIDCRCP